MVQDTPFTSMHTPNSNDSRDACGHMGDVHNCLASAEEEILMDLNDSGSDTKDDNKDAEDDDMDNDFVPSLGNHSRTWVDVECI